MLEGQGCPRTGAFDEAIQEMRRCYGKRYLLHTGRIMPRKNVEKLVQAFELLAPRFEDLHLVLTGGAGFGSAEVIRQIEDSLYRERIHLAGWVPEEELAALYSAATALVFPSRFMYSCDTIGTAVWASSSIRRTVFSPR